ncbi:MAG TPA: DUF2326 domain-containing protein, partial [Roseiarcus sp.]|nr:DUF2326 domain-containing protein [Roseiarcus sp.]
MLHRISSDHASFKTFEFRKGLNIILADRQNATDDKAAPAQDKRTRNGAGKSSFIDLVHFLLAGGPEGALKSKELAEWTFNLCLDVGDERLVVERKLDGSRLSISSDRP